jgi:hypothetical protein
VLLAFDEEARDYRYKMREQIVPRR